MDQNIRVAVSDFTPLVIDANGVYEGFEIDLWEAVAHDADIHFEYEKHGFKDIIPLLTEKKIDVALAGITINEEREKRIDFSHSTLDSGLLISVNKNRNKINFLKTVSSLLSEGRKMIASAAISVTVFIIVFVNLLWFAERHVTTFNKAYFPGIFESAWLVICSMSTDSFGDYVPHTWLGRIITMCIIVGGVAIFGLLIAQITAFIAVRRVKGEINTSRDLHNKKVATVEGTTSESFLKRVGAHLYRVSKIDEAMQKLIHEEVDAVVFDAPTTIYYEKNDTSDMIELVGEMFDKQKYGIAMQQNSPLREQINQSVLKIKESGQYDILYKKWFGDDSVME